MRRIWRKEVGFPVVCLSVPFVNRNSFFRVRPVAFIADIGQDGVRSWNPGKTLSIFYSVIGTVLHRIVRPDARLQMLLVDRVDPVPDRPVGHH